VSETAHSPASFLASIPEADRDELAVLGRRRAWERGEILVRAGDTADTAIVVLAGVAKVHTQTTHGAEVILNLCGPGDLLGEVTAVRKAQRSATATAIQRVSGFVLTISDVRSFLASHPRASLALLDLALTRLHRADADRLEFAAADTLGRVARRLVELAERFGESCADGTIEIGLAIPQEDIAAWSAASRESTARALRTLRQLRLIESHRLRLVVMDMEQLRRHAARLERA
jgi:CRP/FNR family cyclic AMP-dependent transcriptional regulator